MTCEVVHPPPDPPGTGAAKDGERYNKVEGVAWRSVTDARGGGNPSRYLQESGVLARLTRLCDAACPRCRDPASPRGPEPAAAAAGERVSPRGSLSPRIPPGGSWVPREAGGTGRDRAGPASQSTPRSSVLLPPPGVQLSARVPPARGAARRSRTRTNLD